MAIECVFPGLDRVAWKAYELRSACMVIDAIADDELGAEPGFDGRQQLILNLHEWWLLRTVRVGRREQRALLQALTDTGQVGGDVDVLAEVGGYTLAKRSVPKDLAVLFDQLINPYDAPAHGVAYGNRRYRKPVILAAALHQAGVDAETYRAGVAAGYRTLAQYKTLALRR